MSKYNELEQLAKDFYELFDTLICIYDSNKKIIASYPHRLCSFCSEVRKDKHLRMLCLEHDKNALQTLDKTHTTLIYHCHMGLIEVAAPIMQGGIILGYLLFGQLTDDRSNSESMKIISKLSTELSADKLLLELQLVRFCTREKIEAMSRMLTMCAAYIQTSGILPVNKESIGSLIDEYIQARIQNGKIKMDDICRQFYISRSSLHLIAKKNFGMSMGEYITSARIKAAEKLLRTEEISIDTVAEKTGFGSGNYFCKVFRRYTGLTPGEYKAKFKA